MPPTQEELDVRSCVLKACHRVGLYRQIANPNSTEFLDRSCKELVTLSGDSCPIGPPYNNGLMTFRQAMRLCLEDKGYSGFKIFLQKLCTRAYTWKDFCEYHADGL